MAEVNRVSFNVSITEGDLRDFTLYESYHNVRSWFSIVIGVLCFGFGSYVMMTSAAQSIIFYLFAAILLIRVPWTARAKASRMMAGGKYDQKITYSIGPDGVSVKQGTASGTMPWERFTEVRRSKRCLLLFVGPGQALIFPLSSIGKKYQAVMGILRKRMPAGRVRVK